MKQRIEWVDYLKAIAIICVVFGHIEFFGMQGYSGFFNRLQNVFCMPLFFLISGMFAKRQHSLSAGWQCVRGKFQQLVIPFISVGLLCTFLCTSRPLSSLFWFPQGGAHNGYWFVWVLFEVYLLFTLGQQISHNIEKPIQRHFSAITRGKIELFIYSLMWVMLFGIKQTGILPEEPWQTLLSFYRITGNFPFFIAGFYLIKYLSFITHQRTLTYGAILSLALFIAYDKFEIQQIPIQAGVTLALIGVILHFAITLENRLPLKKTMIYIGTHTIDIYLLHYFFLPRSLPWLNTIIAPNGKADQNTMLEFFICLTISGGVIVLSLLVSALLQKSPLLSRILLGKKIHRPLPSAEKTSA